LAEESQSSDRGLRRVTFAAPFEVKAIDRTAARRGLAYHTVVSASGGRVPRAGISLLLRYYAKFP
jgi:hypothetical protein